MRFGPDRTQTYLRTRHGFVFDDAPDKNGYRYAAQWDPDVRADNPLTSFDLLDRANSAADATRALAAFPGPVQNFVIADAAGNATYHLAGRIPDDPAWGRRAYDGASVADGQHGMIAFDQLPQVPASRAAVAFTANARMYGAGYPYQLSPAFAPPYRAYRIHQMLQAHTRYGDDDFAAIQRDVTSVSERELAQAVVAALGHKHVHGPVVDRIADALRHFDGEFQGTSRAATAITWIRLDAVVRFVSYHLPTPLARRYLSLAQFSNEAYVAVLRMLRERPHGYVPHDDYDQFLVDSVKDAITQAEAHSQGVLDPWSKAWQVTPAHPLSGIGLTFWNGTPFPGLGGPFTPRVQNTTFSQSFRAVWDVGNWDAGGIVIPEGESGRPGNEHYRDAAPAWIDGTLIALPYSDAAVASATKHTLLLAP